MQIKNHITNPLTSLNNVNQHIDNDNVLIQLTVNSKVRNTTIKLASGTELYIEEFDPYAFLETTFSRNKIVAPANIETVLADEV